MILRTMATAPRDNTWIGVAGDFGVLAVRKDVTSPVSATPIWRMTGGGHIEEGDIAGWFDLGEVLTLLPKVQVD